MNIKPKKIYYKVDRCLARYCPRSEANNSALQYHTIQCNTMQYNEVPYNTMQCNAMPCNTIQYNAVSCNTKQCHTVQYHTVQCHTVSKIHTQIKKLKFSRCNQKLWLCYLRALQNCFCLVTGSKKNGSKRSKKCTFSDLAYHSSKSGKRIKQKSIPPFWGDVGVKKWSLFLDLGARSPIFGHLKMGTFDRNRQNPFELFFSSKLTFCIVFQFWVRAQRKRAQNDPKSALFQI